MNLSLTVETPDSFRFRTTLMSHGWIQLSPFRHDESFTELRRIQRLGDGRVVELVFSADSDETIHVLVEAYEPTEGSGGGLTDGHRREIEAVTKRIFNLDVGLDSFYALLDGVDRYQWVCRFGGGRLLRAPTVWEDLAKTLLTTNTAWSMTRRMVGRLTELGEPAADRGFAFPSPERVAALSLADLADQVRAGYRNAYLHDLARDIAEGRVDVEAWAQTDLPSQELFQKVRALKGFGPYAAGAVLKLLGRFDYLALDSAARSMFVSTFHSGDPVTDRQIHRHYERYGAWRGLVIWMDVMRDWFVANHPEQTDLGRPET